MPKLVATVEVRYAGRTVKRGEEFDASDQDAIILTAIQKAHAAPAKADLSVRKQPLRTAALQAEPVPETKTEVGPMTTEDAPAPPRRRYQRRDLTAEE